MEHSDEHRCRPHHSETALAQRIQPPDASPHYVMLLKRSELREFKQRIRRSTEACQTKTDTSPYQMIVPRTNCEFVFIPVQQDHIANRVTGLQNFTYAVNYDQQLEKCIGVSFANVDRHVRIDCCFLQFAWKADAVMDQMLRDNNPFRPVKPQRVNQHG